MRYEIKREHNPSENNYPGYPFIELWEENWRCSEDQLLLNLSASSDGHHALDRTIQYSDPVEQLRIKTHFELRARTADRT